MMSAQNSALACGVADALDIATLESFDPSGGRGSALNRRFCCPLCGTDKPRDAAHRSLIYRTDSGAWNCKRCGASGKLRDFWEKRDGATTGATGANWRRSRAQNERAQLSQLRASAERDDEPAPKSAPQATEQATPAPDATTGKSCTDWRRGLKPLAGTPGADYLSGRGIPLDVARLAGVRFCPTWLRSEKWRGCAAVVFPIRDRAGEVIAAQGRRIEKTSGPNALTSGPKSRGLFVAPAQAGARVWRPFDADGPGVFLCEAPIDALSLAACGFPALALCGINGGATTGPTWLRLACGLKSVYLAFDADGAGDDAAGAMAALLGTYGARCVTLRPDGAKDWNEALQASGRDALSDWIAARVLL